MHDTSMVSENGEPTNTSSPNASNIADGNDVNSATEPLIEQRQQEPQQQQQQPPLDLAGRPFPPIVDPEVFKELPVEVQEELLQQWQGQATNQATSISMPSTVTSTMATESHSTTMIKSKTTAKNGKSNTLHRYFITNN